MMELNSCIALTTAMRPKGKTDDHKKSEKLITRSLTVRFKTDKLNEISSLGLNFKSNSINCVSPSFARQLKTHCFLDCRAQTLLYVCGGYKYTYLLTLPLPDNEGCTDLVSCQNRILSRSNGIHSDRLFPCQLSENVGGCGGGGEDGRRGRQQWARYRRFNVHRQRFRHSFDYRKLSNFQTRTSAETAAAAASASRVHHLSTRN